MSSPGIDAYEQEEEEEDKARPVFTKTKAQRAARAAPPPSMTSVSPILVQDQIPLLSLSLGHEDQDTILYPDGQNHQRSTALDLHDEPFSETKQLVYNTQ